jgi:hypothetical protein
VTRAGVEGAWDSLPQTFQIAIKRCRILKGRVASANPNLSICVLFARGMVDAPNPDERNGRVIRHGLRRSWNPACAVGGKVFMRHMFAIKDLGQSGWFKPHRYRYFCVLCRWTFLVENRRGDATAWDESGHALSGAESAARVATFAVGPCPAAMPEIQFAERESNGHRKAETEYHRHQRKRPVLLPLQYFLAKARSAFVRRSLQDTAPNR